MAIYYHRNNDITITILFTLYRGRLSAHRNQTKHVTYANTDFSLRNHRYLYGKSNEHKKYTTKRLNNQQISYRYTRNGKSINAYKFADCRCAGFAAGVLSWRYQQHQAVKNEHPNPNTQKRQATTPTMWWNALQQYTSWIICCSRPGQYDTMRILCRPSSSLFFLFYSFDASSIPFFCSLSLFLSFLLFWFSVFHIFRSEMLLDSVGTFVYGTLNVLHSIKNVTQWIQFNTKANMQYAHNIAENFCCERETSWNHAEYQSAES